MSPTVIFISFPHSVLLFDFKNFWVMIHNWTDFAAYKKHQHRIAIQRRGWQVHSRPMRPKGFLNLRRRTPPCGYLSCRRCWERNGKRVQKTLWISCMSNQIRNGKSQLELIIVCPHWTVPNKTSTHMWVTVWIAMDLWQIWSDLLTHMKCDYGTKISLFRSFLFGLCQDYFIGISVKSRITYMPFKHNGVKNLSNFVWILIIKWLLHKYQHWVIF